ncbi:TMEM175 family protein [Miniphocaeibacter massiliensis]|uniref:TMEM175 family protein n=1 Tax=Miniphocaeibacter massiliensis TaxID=2041841 RepID=UPI000C06FA2E|nr:TMEM175 family protein [Miniphocaeibacter massiliensis]
MSKSRLEAFSDGVMAIVITILVLNISAPAGDSFRDLQGIEKKLFVYLFSFTVVAVYWNNHHHLFQIVKRVNGKILWANNFFLFSLTLFPFATSWISEHLFSLFPQLLCGVVILLADIAFFVLIITINKVTSKDNNFNLKRHKKTLFSIFLNIIAICLGVFIKPILVTVINIMMILLWIVPSKRIENIFNEDNI